MLFLKSFYILIFPSIGIPNKIVYFDCNILGKHRAEARVFGQPRRSGNQVDNSSFLK